MIDRRAASGDERDTTTLRRPAPNRRFRSRRTLGWGVPLLRAQLAALLLALVAPLLLSTSSRAAGRPPFRVGVATAVYLPPGSTGSDTSQIVLTGGADGNLWVFDSRSFLATAETTILKFATDGQALATYVLPSGIDVLTPPPFSGPDGALWFVAPRFAPGSNPLMPTSYQTTIGRVAPSGALATANVLTTQPQQPLNIGFDATFGPDGDIWTPGSTQIVPTTGQATLFPDPSALELARGPGGLWVLDRTSHTTYAIRPLSPTGVLGPLQSLGSLDFSPTLSSGPDNSLWVADRGVVFRITAHGGTTRYTLPHRGCEAVIADERGGFLYGPSSDRWLLTQAYNNSPTCVRAMGRSPHLVRVSKTGRVSEVKLPAGACTGGVLFPGPNDTLWCEALQPSHSIGLQELRPA
jgi:hypothetical protein